MPSFRQVCSHVAGLFRRRHLEAEMAEEMRQHLERRTEEKIAAGMTPAEARTAAQREFGGIAQVQEHCRDEQHGVWLEQAWRDLRFAARSLRNSPGFTLVVVLTLALGVGANTALFSIINSVLLRPLPYADADRLVWLAEQWPDVPKGSISFPNYLDWREQQVVFDRMGAYRIRPYNLTGGADPLHAAVGEISLDVLLALGIPPARGRLFTADEDSAGGPAVALLSDGLWRTRFGAEPDIVGRQVTLNGQSHTVVGVMPPGFDFPRGANLWIPLGPAAAAANLSSRAAHSGHYAVARLRPEVTLAQARQNLDAIATQLSVQYPEANRGHRALLTPLHSAVVEGAGRTLWPLFGAAGLVLLIACANVANLLLARASARQKEIALRAALGASGVQIARQLLVESVLLAGLGGLAGLLLAQAALRGIVAVMAPALPVVSEPGLDGTVLGFCAGAALLSAVLFGLAPAWHASRVPLQAALQSATRGSSGRRGKLRLGLIVAEFALTLVLLVGAGLLLRTLVRLENVDPGYRTASVLTFRVDLTGRQYPAAAQRVAFFEQLLEKLRTLPGVTGASLTSHVPLAGSASTNGFVIDGRPAPAPGAQPFANTVYVEGDYFRTLGIRVLRGRTFTAQDGVNGAQSVIIDEEFARRYWRGQDPLGQRLRFGPGGSEAPLATIVGVVGRVRQETLSDPVGNVQAYLPYAANFRTGMSVVVRTSGDPGALAASVREQVRALDPNQPVHAMRTLEELRDRSGSPQRVTLLLLGAFALVALGLAAVGLYGVLSYLVAQRQREIGVRIALGAGAADVVRMILREGLAFVLLGAALGVLGALGLGQVLRHVLVEVSPHDPLTLGAVLGVLTAVAVLACWLPARQAARIDPMIALRSE